MSEAASWTERAAPVAAARRITGETAGPELVVNHDEPEVNPFADHRDYIAVRGVSGRTAQDTCFIDDDGVPHFKPWAYYLGAEAHPAHRGLTLHWPGARIEVAGDDLRSIYPLIMTRRAGVWQVLNAARHDPPKPGMPVIHSIRVVVTNGHPAA